MKSDSFARQSVPLNIRSEPPVIEPLEIIPEQKPLSPLRSKRTGESKSQSSTLREQTEDLETSQKQSGPTSKQPLSKSRVKTLTKTAPKKPGADEDTKEELKKLERLKFQLRGKDYTYDHNGEIIVVNQLRADKLPMHQVNPDVQLPGPDVDNSLSKQPIKRKTIKKSQNDQNDGVTSLAVSQPMIDTIVPAKGVTFKNGKKVIRGEPMVDDPSETLKSRRFREGGFNPSLQPLDGILRPPKKVNVSAKKIFDQIDSYQEVDEDAEEEALVNATTKDFNQIQDEEIEPAPAQNPAKLPPKNLRVVHATPGHLPYTTRTRKNVIPTKNRQRLPPPLYPATRGHGVMTSYLSQDNPYVQQYQSYLQSFQQDEQEGTIQSHIFEEEYSDGE